jgi:hypothetical protein
MDFHGLDSSCPGQGPEIGSCEHCSEILDSIKYWASSK